MSGRGSDGLSDFQGSSALAGTSVNINDAMTADRIFLWVFMSLSD
jgi:hypothetical protein